MHEHEGDAHALRYMYRLIDLDVLGLTVEALPDLILAAARTGFAGLNITYPCKQAVIPLLDELSADAEAIGAVNTVLFKSGRRIGFNTDWSGFAESFRRTLGDAPRERVLQLGAGGAGAAVAHALLKEDARHLVIVDTVHERADDLARALNARFGAGRASAAVDAAAAIASADGLVNTTPMGMAKFPGMAVPKELIVPKLWVADVVYFPLETELLREARLRGCRTMSGTGMAVFQAADAFRLFSGRDPDAERMLRDFESM